MDDETVSYYNGQQVSRSTRYLYSDVDDFDFARNLVARQTELREVVTHVTLGEMGRGPAPRTQMPSGMNLVINGAHDHCVLPIVEVDDSGEGITARTTRMELLAQVAADPGMLRVDLYDGGRVMRSVRQGMVEVLAGLGDGWFRVVHRDPLLRGLAAHLDLNR